MAGWTANRRIDRLLPRSSLIVLLLAAVPLYVLSIGPAISLAQEKYLPAPLNNAIWWFYQPVFAAVRHNDYLNTKPFSYPQWWGFEIFQDPFTVHRDIPTFS